MKTKILIAFMLVSLIGYSQKSPVKQANGSINGTEITIDYSSPKTKERVIYGELVPYGEVWRAGANKNTTIDFSNDVEINGQKLAAGKYGFFIIPNTNKGWIAIFNKKNDGWGAFSYSESRDVLRVEHKVQKNDTVQEELTYSITKKGINFSWDTVNFTLRVK